MEFKNCPQNWVANTFPVKIKHDSLGKRMPNQPVVLSATLSSRLTVCARRSGKKAQSREHTEVISLRRACSRYFRIYEPASRSGLQKNSRRTVQRGAPVISEMLGRLGCLERRHFFRLIRAGQSFDIPIQVIFQGISMTRMELASVPCWSGWPTCICLVDILANGSTLGVILW